MTRSVVLGCVLLAGCAGLRPLSPEAVELRVPAVGQDALHDCGLSAVSSLCAYHGVELPDASRDGLAQRAAAGPGLSAGDLGQELERLGFEVFLFPGTTEDDATGLPHHVRAGRPVLVLLRQGGSAHYVLVTGHDPRDGRFVLLDPRRGRLVVTRDEFERLWAPAQRLALLAVPP